MQSCKNLIKPSVVQHQFCNPLACEIENPMIFFIKLIGYNDGNPEPLMQYNWTVCWNKGLNPSEDARY